MIKKLFLFCILLVAVSVITWPSLRSQIVDEDNQISLAKIKTLGNSFGANAIELLEQASSAIKETSTQVSNTIEEQSGELKEKSDQILSQIDDEDTR
ncbi:MAG: hypothetical protein KDD62_16420, partial [Bdellovibrionales bacterium]|nr:hypothetical protein [Bdellovibrionales bacterium]